MGQTIFEKIIRAHMVEGECTPGKEVAIKIDQTLTQDSLGAMAYLQFEAMHKPKVETELSVSYTDHLMLQLGQGNGDVHRYLETVADKFGIVYSKAGNGICHQVHLERFSKPGKTLIGSDSHTVTCGSVGMAAFGAGRPGRGPGHGRRSPLHYIPPDYQGEPDRPVKALVHCQGRGS